jgi:inhibitor of KinA
MINFILEMEATSPYKIFFISDSAITVDFGNVINEIINKKLIALFAYLSEHPLEGMKEAVPAYSSLTIYFDVPLLRKKIAHNKPVYKWMKGELDKLLQKDLDDIDSTPRAIRIPVCYTDEFGPDLQSIAQAKQVTVEDIIRLHTSKEYRVYMLGFLPGFAYMGELAEEIAMPRKQQPEPTVAGSVGLAGKQTGIYPLNSPGGWQIIGRTPLKMFDKEKDDPCLLKMGDSVAFYSITKNEFENYQGGNS